MFAPRMPPVCVTFCFCFFFFFYVLGTGMLTFALRFWFTLREIAIYLNLKEKKAPLFEQ